MACVYSRRRRRCDRCEFACAFREALPDRRHHGRRRRYEYRSAHTTDPLKESDNRFDCCPYPSRGDVFRSSPFRIGGMDEIARPLRFPSSGGGVAATTKKAVPYRSWSRRGGQNLLTTQSAPFQRLMGVSKPPLEEGNRSFDRVTLWTAFLSSLRESCRA